MPLSWNEIRNRAHEFSKRWENETSEDAEAKPFWTEFFNVFGIDRKRVASFEEPVKKLGDKQGYIDMFWKGMLLVEREEQYPALMTSGLNFGYKRDGRPKAGLSGQAIFESPRGSTVFNTKITKGRLRRPAPRAPRRWCRRDDAAPTHCAVLVFLAKPACGGRFVVHLFTADESADFAKMRTTAGAMLGQTPMDPGSPLRCGRDDDGTRGGNRPKVSAFAPSRE